MKGWAFAMLLSSGLLAQCRVTLLGPVQEPRFATAFCLRVQRAAPLGSRFAAFEPKQLAPLVVLDAVALTLGEQAGQWVEEWQVQASCLQVGQVQIAPYDDAVVLPDGRAQAVPCAGLTLQVGSLLPDPVGALEWPHQGRERTPLAWSPWWWLSLLALPGLWLKFRRVARRANVTALPACFALALAQLRALDADATSCWPQLVAILRQFLTELRAIPAFARTSEELWQQCDVPNAALRACLLPSDLAQFGACPGDAAARRQAIAAAVQFVQQLQQRVGGLA